MYVSHKLGSQMKQKRKEIKDGETTQWNRQQIGREAEQRESGGNRKKETSTILLDKMRACVCEPYGLKTKLH